MISHHIHKRYKITRDLNQTPHVIWAWRYSYHNPNTSEALITAQGYPTPQIRQWEDRLIFRILTIHLQNVQNIYSYASSCMPFAIFIDVNMYTSISMVLKHCPTLHAKMHANNNVQEILPISNHEIQIPSGRPSYQHTVVSDPHACLDPAWFAKCTHEVSSPHPAATSSHVSAGIPSSSTKKF